MQGSAALRISEDRRDTRDEVFHRTRATTADGVPLMLLVVNLSPGGLMARLDHPFIPGDRLRVLLPDSGMVPVEVRWALGGRIGCRFDQSIAPDPYARLLAIMARA